MAEMTARLRTAGRFVERHRGVILPLAVAALIFVILVPVPPVLMDLLLAANIALSAVVLLTAIYVATPLEFSVFPSLLLVATLVRLVLNVATTRLILTAGAGAAGPEAAQLAAGRVIWAFSSFVSSGSLAVGVILFVMLVVIQFVVVTKGAARVSEVAARFVLDAMPGKQMAVDAEISSGAIDEREARQRRRQIAREADFYGAMDGASKFLRGDAIAAVIITLVNILGGLYIGMVQYGWPWSRTVDLFTRLTVGDGLVTQIPAFLVCISAGLIVTRSTARTNLGEDMIAQLTGNPAVLVITGVFLAVLTLTSLPALPLMTLGAGCLGLAVVLRRRRKVPAASPRCPAAQARKERAQSLEDLLTVEPIRIELGYRLVGLVDDWRGGDLLERIAGLRKQIATELGLLVPPVKVADNISLPANAYAILIRGSKVAGSTLHPSRLLAVGRAEADGQPQENDLDGIAAVEPTFATPAVWIAPDRQADAEAAGYVVVEPPVVIATHLGAVVSGHAAELLGRQQVTALLENLGARSGDLVAEARQRFGVSRIQKVLRRLLDERVPIRDLEAILDALCQSDADVEDIEELTEAARSALWRPMSQQYCGPDGTLWCLQLHEEVEQRIGTYVADSPGMATSAVPAELSQAICAGIREHAGRFAADGRRCVLLCAAHVRPTVRRIVSTVTPETAVLGYNEVNCVKVQSIGSVGGT